MHAGRNPAQDSVSRHLLIQVRAATLVASINLWSAKTMKPDKHIRKLGSNLSVRASSG